MFRSKKSNAKTNDDIDIFAAIDKTAHTGRIIRQLESLREKIIKISNESNNSEDKFLTSKYELLNTELEEIKEKIQNDKLEGDEEISQKLTAVQNGITTLEVAGKLEELFKSILTDHNNDYSKNLNDLKRQIDKIEVEADLEPIIERAYKEADKASKALQKVKFLGILQDLDKLSKEVSKLTIDQIDQLDQNHTTITQRIKELRKKIINTRPDISSDQNISITPTDIEEAIQKSDEALQKLADLHLEKQQFILGIPPAVTKAEMLRNQINDEHYENIKSYLKTLSDDLREYAPLFGESLLKNEQKKAQESQTFTKEEIKTKIDIIEKIKEIFQKKQILMALKDTKELTPFKTNNNLERTLNNLLKYINNPNNTSKSESEVIKHLTETLNKYNEELDKIIQNPELDKILLSFNQRAKDVATFPFTFIKNENHEKLNNILLEISKFQKNIIQPFPLNLLPELPNYINTIKDLENRVDLLTKLEPLKELFKQLQTNYPFHPAVRINGRLTVALNAIEENITSEHHINPDEISKKIEDFSKNLTITNEDIVNKKKKITDLRDQLNLNDNGYERETKLLLQRFIDDFHKSYRLTLRDFDKLNLLIKYRLKDKNINNQLITEAFNAIIEGLDFPCLPDEEYARRIILTEHIQQAKAELTKQKAIYKFYDFKNYQTELDGIETEFLRINLGNENQYNQLITKIDKHRKSLVRKVENFDSNKGKIKKLLDNVRAINETGLSEEKRFAKTQLISHLVEFKSYYKEHSSYSDRNLNKVLERKEMYDEINYFSILLQNEINDAPARRAALTALGDNFFPGEKPAPFELIGLKVKLKELENSDPDNEDVKEALYRLQVFINANSDPNGIFGERRYRYRADEPEFAENVARYEIHNPQLYVADLDVSFETLHLKLDNLSHELGGTDETALHYIKRNFPRLKACEDLHLLRLREFLKFSLPDATPAKKQALDTLNSFIRHLRAGTQPKHPQDKYDELEFFITRAKRESKVPANEAMLNNALLTLQNTFKVKPALPALSSKEFLALEKDIQSVSLSINVLTEKLPRAASNFTIKEDLDIAKLELFTETAKNKLRLYKSKLREQNYEANPLNDPGAKLLSKQIEEINQLLNKIEDVQFYLNGIKTQDITKLALYGSSMKLIKTETKVDDEEDQQAKDDSHHANTVKDIANFLQSKELVGEEVKSSGFIQTDVNKTTSVYNLPSCDGQHWFSDEVKIPANQTRLRPDRNIDPVKIATVPILDKEKEKLTHHFYFNPNDTKRLEELGVKRYTKVFKSDSIPNLAYFKMALNQFHVFEANNRYAANKSVTFISNNLPPEYAEALYLLLLNQNYNVTLGGKLEYLKDKVIDNKLSLLNQMISENKDVFSILDKSHDEKEEAQQKTEKAFGLK